MPLEQSDGATVVEDGEVGDGLGRVEVGEGDGRVVDLAVGNAEDADRVGVAPQTLLHEVRDLRVLVVDVAAALRGGQVLQQVRHRKHGLVHRGALSMTVLVGRSAPAGPPSAPPRRAGRRS